MYPAATACEILVFLSINFAYTYIIILPFPPCFCSLTSLLKSFLFAGVPVAAPLPRAPPLIPLVAGDLDAAALLKPHPPSMLSLCDEGGGGWRSRTCSSSATVEEMSNLEQQNEQNKFGSFYNCNLVK